MKHISAYATPTAVATPEIFTLPISCEQCDDQGVVAYRDANRATRTKPCPNLQCLAGQEYRKRLIGILQKYSEIPDRYKGFTSWEPWENLPDEYIEGKITALLAVRQFVKKPMVPFSKAQLHSRYQGNDTLRSSILITGERGMGKTALVSTMVHLLTENLIPTQFITPRGLWIRLRKTFNSDDRQENEAAIIHQLIHVPVLVIDEFNVNASDYLVTIFEQIIRERYNAFNARPIIATANAKKDELIEVWGGPTISALTEMGHVIPMGGKPLRDESGEIEEEPF